MHSKKIRRKNIATIICKNSNSYKRDNLYCEIFLGVLFILAIIGAFSLSYWLSLFIRLLL